MGPAFNRMWAGNIVSNLSDGILIAAFPLLAISLTESTVLISAIGAISMLPWLLFAIPIGALVDRVDRRFILAGANAIRSALVGVFALLIATQHVTIYWLILSSFLVGICEVAADTTSHSLIPQILEEKNFEKGNSRLQISDTVIQGFIGAPISGFIYAISISLPFFINSMGFAISALLALSIPIKYLQDVRNDGDLVEKKSFVADMKFGMRYLYNEKILRRLVVTTASVGLCYSMGTATLVLFLVKELKLPEHFFGLVFSVTGVGAIIGSVLAPRASKLFGRSQMMTFGIFSSSLVLIVQGLAPNIYVFVALATFGAFAISQWNILLMATYQSIIPTELYGRIHGTRRTIVWGMMPFGSLLGGVVAHYGFRIPLIIGGVIATMISAYSLRFFLSLEKLASPAVDVKLEP
jgi:MFS family permease